jgi:predicted ABC-type ATPase
VPASNPTIYLIGGCNGAGKTTFARDYLPREVKCLRFFNADEIARGLSPLDPVAGAVKAGRYLLNEVRQSIARRETFALETTLSGLTYIRLLRSAKTIGFEIEIHYLWLATAEQAVRRVAKRVRAGGHAVPERDIRRRFHAHLLYDYFPFADRWVIWDNRTLPGALLASSGDCDINELRRLLGV